MTMNHNRALRGLAAAALLASAGLSLGACGAGSMPSPEMASIKVPEVRQTMMVYDLSFEPGGSISSDQRRSLAEWFDGIGVNYGDRVSVDDNGPGSGIRRSVVADVLAQHGLLLSDGAPVTKDGAGTSNARVIVMRAAASVPGCPDWSRRSNPEFEASKMSNFGCASESNLAAMVVDANDLVSGKMHTGTDALTTVKAIENYRARAGMASDKVKSTVGEASETK